MNELSLQMKNEVSFRKRKKKNLNQSQQVSEGVREPDHEEKHLETPQLKTKSSQ